MLYLDKCQALRGRVLGLGHLGVAQVLNGKAVVLADKVIHRLPMKGGEVHSPCKDRGNRPKDYSATI